jgi:Protein of unknown function (DUF3795)
MKEELKIGICGNVCSECNRYIATRNNDITELEKAAELWFRLGFRDKIVAPEELKCEGCSKEIDCAYKINNCEHLAGKNNCGECDIYPCDRLNSIFEKTDKFARICRKKCSDSEYLQLEKAFFNKRTILNDINKKVKG